MITHQISPPPLLSQFELNHHMTQHHPMKKTIAGLSASSPTSLPAPPLSLNIGTNRDNEVNIKDRSIFHQLLKSITDPWNDLPSDYSTEATRRALRESVMNFYNLKRNLCMVLGVINKKSKHVVTGHIYPKSKSTGLQFFDLQLSDIDNPRNCLRLTKEIERAFDAQNLTIIKKNGELKIFLLNNTMSSKRITPVSPHTFGSIHGLSLMFNNEKRPFHRLLALHCYSSFNNARLKQQEFLLNDEDLNNAVFYVENLLNISFDSHKRENVTQWLYHNPVGPGASLLQSQIISQFIYEFVEQYTENSSHMSIIDRIKLAVEDLSHIFPLDQALFVRELITHVLKLKPKIVTVVGCLLDSAQKEQVLNMDGITNGILNVFEIADSFSTSIWRPIGEILGTFIGSAEPQSMMNISILKTIMDKVPVQNSKEVIAYIIEYAQQISSKSKFISLWKLSGLTFDDLLKPVVLDQQFLSAYDWLLNPTLTDRNEITQLSTPSLASSSTQVIAVLQSPWSSTTTMARSDINLKMNPSDKYYIQNIILSYLESCLVVQNPTKARIDEYAIRQGICILKSIIHDDNEKEIQVLYAIQNFIVKLEYPPKMARLLFDVFYDEGCVREAVFQKWRQNLDQEEINVYSAMIDATKDFFDWLLLADTESTEEDEDDEKNTVVILDVLRKKGLILPKDLTTHQITFKGSVLHQQNILIRTPGPARHSLTLTNTHSPKSISLHDNEQSLTGKSTIATPSTIHESDEGIVENNSDDDEDADRSSNTIDDSNNYATILNKTNSLERFTDSFVLSAIVWRNPHTKSLLLSGSSFCNKGYINLVVKEPQPNSIPSVLVEQTIEYVSQIEQHNEVQNITNVDTNSIEEDLQNQPKLNFNELNEAEQKDANDSSSLTVFYECVSDMGFIVLDWGSVIDNVKSRIADRPMDLNNLEKALLLIPDNALLDSNSALSNIDWSCLEKFSDDDDDNNDNDNDNDEVMQKMVVLYF
ncbi:unnamed protein product [Rotaria magnacalcarata]|uniref:W2 domain-containing protein n=1 Tax=Rotaria magnacalcarata TaxID=392030 RepID=A0A816YHH1_9BILA|nr:unnamed protein product [Rotaria magnacalcarata]